MTDLGIGRWGTTDSARVQRRRDGGRGILLLSAPPTSRGTARDGQAATHWERDAQRRDALARSRRQFPECRQPLRASPSARWPTPAAASPTGRPVPIGRLRNTANREFGEDRRIRRDVDEAQRAASLGSPASPSSGPLAKTAAGIDASSQGGSATGADALQKSDPSRMEALSPAGASQDGRRRLSLRSTARR